MTANEPMGAFQRDLDRRMQSTEFRHAYEEQKRRLDDGAANEPMSDERHEHVTDERVEQLFKLADEILRAPSRFGKSFIVSELGQAVAELAGAVERSRAVEAKLRAAIADEHTRLSQEMDTRLAEIDGAQWQGSAEAAECELAEMRERLGSCTIGCDGDEAAFWPYVQCSRCRHDIWTGEHIRGVLNLADVVDQAVAHDCDKAAELRNIVAGCGGRE